MKNIWIVVLGAFLLACSSQPRTGEAETEKAGQKPAAEWVEVILNVEGMTCDGCENAIKAGVETLDGIASVESSHEEGWTKVKYNKNSTSVEDIQAKITETGYEVKGKL